MPKLPPARVCLVAEQVRPEPNNKSTILGFLGTSPDAMLLVPSLPTQTQLALMVLCEEVTIGGDTQLEFELIGPTQEIITPRFIVPQAAQMEVGRKAIFVLNFQGLPMPTAGRYSATLYSMGEFHSRHYFDCLTPADLSKRSSAAGDKSAIQ